MPGSVYLRGEAVTLRTIEEEDLPFLRDLINEPTVRRYLPHRPPYNLEQEREFFEGEVCGDDSVNLLICRDDEPTGTIGLHHPNPVSGSAELGIIIGEPFWGEGIGTDASRTVTDYAFEERRLHRVEARVIDGNDASQAIWENLGFRHEGTFREAEYVGGGYRDVHLYAVIESEWNAG